MSFDVVVDELRGHASHLDGLMDRLSTAVSAANTVSMSDDAYGLLCSFLPPIINPMEQEGISSITAASEAVGTTAGNVRKAADYYEESDKANAQPFAATLSESAGGSTGSMADMATSTPRRATSAMSPVETGTPMAPLYAPMQANAPMAPMAPTAMSTPVEPTAPTAPLYAPVQANAPMAPLAPMSMSVPMEPTAPMAARAMSAPLEPQAPVMPMSAAVRPTMPDVTARGTDPS